MPSYIIFNAAGDVLRQVVSNTAQALEGGEYSMEGEIDPASQRIDTSDFENPEIVAIDVDPPTLSELKQSAKARAATRRWEVETGGITVSGTPTTTDERSRELLTRLSKQALAGTFLTTYKDAAGNWVPLSATAIIAIDEGVDAHIQACFAREKALDDLIDAAADESELAALDSVIQDFWP